MRSRLSPADKRLVAVRAGSPLSFDGDVSVQARPADQAATTVTIKQPVLAVGRANVPAGRICRKSSVSSRIPHTLPRSFARLDSMYHFLLAFRRSSMSMTCIP